MNQEQLEAMRLRRTLLLNAIEQATTDGVEITVENLKPLLPSDYFMVPEDFELIAPVIEPPAVAGELVAIESDDTVTRNAVIEPVDSQPPPVVVLERLKVTPTPTINTIEQATDATIVAQNALAEARVHLTVCGRQEGEARAALAEAISQFQSGFQKITPEQLRRNYAIEQQEYRRAVAAGEIAPRQRPRIANSNIDRSAAYSRGDMEAGTYRSYARGAHPASRQGSFIRRPKLPSAR